jgi:hypothetical protein
VHYEKLSIKRDLAYCFLRSAFIHSHRLAADQITSTKKIPKLRGRHTEIASKPVPTKFSMAYVSPWGSIFFTLRLEKCGENEHGPNHRKDLVRVYLKIFHVFLVPQF